MRSKLLTLFAAAACPFRSTYTFDWQPSGITWYLNGREIDRLTGGEGKPLPHKPMYTMLSIWTKDSDDFGGRVAPQHNYNTQFEGMARLVCAKVSGH